MPAHAFTIARKVRLALLVSIGLLVLLSGVLLAAPFAIERYGEQALRSAGFEDAEISGVRLALDGVRIRRLRLAGGERFLLRDIAVRFSWSSLWAGRAQRLAIAEVRLDAAISPTGNVQLPGLAEASGAPRPGFRLPAIPVKTLAVDTATLHLATPAGPVALILTRMRARAEHPSLRADAELRLRHALGSVDGHIEAELPAPGRPFAVRLAVREGELSGMHTVIAGLHGEARASLPTRGPLAGALDLSAAAASYREIGLGTLNLTANLNGSQVRYRLDSPPSATAALALGGEADLETQRATLAGEVRLPSLARLPDFNASGRAALTSDLAFDWSEDTPRVMGQLELKAAALALEGWTRRGRLRLGGVVEATAERIALTSRTPWQGEATLTGHLLPSALQAYAGKRLRLRLEPRASAGAARLVVHPRSRQVMLDGAAAIVAGSTRARAAGALRMRMEDEGLAVNAQPITLALEALRLADLTVGLKRFSGRAELRPPGDWRLQGAGRLTASGALGPARLEGGRFVWRGRLEGDRAVVRMIPARCLRVAAQAVTVRGQRLESFDFPCLAGQAGVPLLRYAIETGRLHFAARSKATALALKRRAGESAHRVTGRWPALTMRGRLGTRGLEELQLRLQGGALRLTEAGIAAKGITGTLALSQGTVEKATLSVAAVKSLAQPALWAPLELDATARRKAGELAFDAVLSDALGIVVFQAEGRRIGAAGRANVTLYPIEFIPQATEPGDISPALGALVSDMTGRVGFDGRLAWKEGALTSGGELRLNAMAATVAGLRFAGLDGALALRSLLPPVTEGVQSLRLAAANIGLLLTDGRLRFALLPEARVRVAEFAFTLAGGQLTAEPFTLDLSQPAEVEIILQAKHVDLNEVARMSGLEGVVAEGELTGRVPISLGRDGLRVAGGRLRAAGEGVLRYTPRQMPAFLRGNDMRTRMLRQVLQNFQYKRLSLTLAGEVGAEQQVHLHARGANPDFMEGHPVILNVRVKGPLVSVVKSALGGTGAKALQRLFKDSEQSNPMPREEGRP